MQPDDGRSTGGLCNLLQFEKPVSVSGNNSERIAEIVESALECDPSERAQFFEKACHDDVGLRKEVESLLGFEQKATDFIEKPAYEIAAETIVDPGGELKAGE